MRYSLYCSPLIEREPRHQEAEEKNYRAASQDLFYKHRVGIAASAPCVCRKMSGYADDEKEKRKDQISRRPSIPWCMLERRIDRAPRSRIVDEQHSGDRDSAKYIQ